MLQVSDFDGEELLALARLDADKGQFAEALYKVKAGLARVEYPDELLALAGSIYAQLRLFAKAKHHLSDYLTLHPESVTERFRLGMVHLDCNEPDQALGLWTGILEATPTHPPSLYYSALVCFRQGEIGEATRHIDVLLKSAEEDNLFFGKGKELLASISAGSGKDSQRASLSASDANRVYGAN